MTKRSYIHIVIIILVLCGLLGTGIAAFLFTSNPDPTTASASIEYTFVGSAESTAPNGVRYNPENIRNDNILEQALITAGLDSKYTPGQIRSSLKVSGIYPQDFVDQVKSFRSLLDYNASSDSILSNYHPTQYNVVLTNEFDSSISASAQSNLLDAILSTYFTAFKRTFGSHLDETIYNDLFSDPNADFIPQLDAIEQEISELSLYAQEMAERSPDLKINGRGFEDVVLRLQHISGTTISQLKANLQVNALAKNPQRLLNQYDFLLRRLLVQLEAEKQHLENLDRLIASFERNGNIYLTSASSTTTLNGNSSLTYDKLIEIRHELTEKISSISSDASTYQKWINNLSSNKQNNPENSFAASDSADELTLADIPQSTDAVDAVSTNQIASFQLQINTIRQSLNQTISEFKALLDAYNDQEINPGTVTISRILYKAPSFLSIAFLKQAIKTSAPFCAAGIILCIVILMPKMKKRYLDR